MINNAWSFGRDQKGREETHARQLAICYFSDAELLAENLQDWMLTGKYHFHYVSLKCLYFHRFHRLQLNREVATRMSGISALLQISAVKKICGGGGANRGVFPPD